MLASNIVTSIVLPSWVYEGTKTEKEKKRKREKEKKRKREKEKKR
ncbi:hypothetical protein [Bacillus sp. FDAARGOS_1420]|nr:hypothetical protein [Bacillus sp. FDAARGOS_1420]